MRKSIYLAILAILLLSPLDSSLAQTKLNYPEAKRVEQVDDYFGTKVADPYRWLEQLDSDETKAWVEAQRKLTSDYLSQIPERARIKDRLTELWNYENGEDFKALYAYSPLHNIKPGTKYPPVLITTADHDDRVFPAHSFKYAATLQAAQAGDAPILIRIETRAGHGAGKPTAKIIEEQADVFGFLVKHLNMSSLPAIRTTTTAE